MRKDNRPPSSLWTQNEWYTVRMTGPIRVMSYSSVEDKVERAHQVVTMIANGKVRLISTDFSRMWIEQLMSFRVSGHDDAVDATVAGVDRFQMNGNEVMSRHLLEAVTEQIPDLDFHYLKAIPNDLSFNPT